MLSHLPVILMVVLMPVIAWFVLGFLEKKPEKQETSEETQGAHGGGGGRALGAPSNMAVPVLPQVLGFVKGNPKKGIYPIITSTNAIAGNKTDLGEIIVSLADKKSVHNAVAQIYVSGNDTDEIIRRINATISEAMAKDQPISFFDRVVGLLSSKLIKETQQPGFRKTLREELQSLCNEVLGSNIVQEVVITKFLAK